MSIETIPHNMTQRARIRAEHEWFAEDVEHVTLAGRMYGTEGSVYRMAPEHECIVLSIA